MTQFSAALFVNDGFHDLKRFPFSDSIKWECCLSDLF